MKNFNQETLKYRYKLASLQRLFLVSLSSLFFFFFFFCFHSYFAVFFFSPFFFVGKDTSFKPSLLSVQLLSIWPCWLSSVSLVSFFSSVCCVSVSCSCFISLGLVKDSLLSLLLPLPLLLLLFSPVPADWYDHVLPNLLLESFSVPLTGVGPSVAKDEVGAEVED